jgi:hypothetical protein
MSIKKTLKAILWAMLISFAVIFVSCEGNAFTVNIKDKTIDRELTTFYIKGDSTYIRYALKLDYLNGSTRKFYLLGTNPNYDVYIQGSMDPVDGGKYKFIPQVNKIYTFENVSNGDASGSEVNVKFDSLYNITIIPQPD